MEDSTMATLNINVLGQPEISGTIPLPLSTGTNYYTCQLGTFAMTEKRGFSNSGNGNSLNISGRFSISAVGDNYGTVTFSGTYVNNGGNGSGNVSWDGTHAPKITGGGDVWTSDTTTPKPKPRPHAKAKSQGK
jgi:hypothetical protein